MRVKTFSFVLLLMGVVAFAAVPASADEATYDLAAEGLEAELLPADLDVGQSEVEVAPGDDEFVIGDAIFAGTRRRCGCQNQCFSDTFCNLLVPGMVCRPVGRCGCRRCVVP